ncbi:MAG TPA: nuclear transport factor 2 family protein [Terriglobales bacterium]|nr:nuclear transport factor 2 family protein [Terriglobales bacterium]
MRHALAIAFAGLLFLSLAAGQDADTSKSTKPKAMNGSHSGSSIQNQIEKLEQDWAQATMKKGAAAVDEYEADDIMTTDPGGRVTDKEQDKKDLSSGDLKFESMELTDLKVHVYGNTAVATGANTLKGTYKGQDIGGTYRFTDTWVKRDGKWRVVSSQATKVQQGG